MRHYYMYHLHHLQKVPDSKLYRLQYRNEEHPPVVVLDSFRPLLLIQLHDSLHHPYTQYTTWYVHSFGEYEESPNWTNHRNPMQNHGWCSNGDHSCFETETMYDSFRHRI